MENQLKYKRILLKLSGELFGNAEGRGIHFPAYEAMAEKIIAIKRSGAEIAVVVGGGNIFRGREAYKKPFDEAVADNIGMIGTVINGLALQETLEKLGEPARMMTAIRMDQVAEPYNRRKAIEHLKKGRIVIFSGGTSNPFFTTDSGAVLRACETDCDAILKATNVDGVYDKDPRQNPEAKLYKKITYKEALDKSLQIMDATAFALAWKKQKPIIVFNEKNMDKVADILQGKEIGTLVI